MFVFHYHLTICIMLVKGFSEQSIICFCVLFLVLNCRLEGSTWSIISWIRFRLFYWFSLFQSPWFVHQEQQYPINYKWLHFHVQFSVQWLLSVWTVFWSTYNIGIINSKQKSLTTKKFTIQCCFVLPRIAIWFWSTIVLASNSRRYLSQNVIWWIATKNSSTNATGSQTFAPFKKKRKAYILNYSWTHLMWSLLDRDNLITLAER